MLKMNIILLIIKYMLSMQLIFKVQKSAYYLRNTIQHRCILSSFDIDI
ncbi:hypothetical protein KL86DYS2_12226 [uncultured Dysgonomonas sp.]|uniref:Uncharacterized protein n=1 Tax=uncultured Dysgonomonas sp. TaxID=206096 RepID=A0A212JSB1_9BACT|nr:hypothetical protein KL86DYS2_12226 [uncultured Dysgonomonas sp.]